MSQLPSIDPRILGQRLAEARKARNRTQEEAASFLGYSRPTLIAMEKGDRMPKAAELMKLAGFYGRTLHDLVRPTAPVGALAPHLRSAVSPSVLATNELDGPIEELARFAEDYKELEDLVREPMRVNYPPEVQLAPRADVDALAEDVAMRERQRLGIGDQPIYNLRGLLENEVGIRIFFGRLPSRLAGMYVYVADLGYCMLINSQHPFERRRLSIAHEYGHFLVDRHRPGVDTLEPPPRKSMNERFAEGYGLSFLMPASGVRRQFNDVVMSSGDFQVADLCRIANIYCVSAQAMTLRLEQLRLVPTGTWDLLKEKGFRPRAAAETLSLPKAQTESSDPYPKRYMFLAVEAYEKELLSEGQLAKFLRCDPIKSREIVAKCTQHTLMDTAGRTREGQMEFNFSLMGEK